MRNLNALTLIALSFVLSASVAAAGDASTLPGATHSDLTTEAVNIKLQVDDQATIDQRGGTIGAHVDVPYILTGNRSYEGLGASVSMHKDFGITDDASDKRVQSVFLALDLGVDAQLELVRKSNEPKGSPTLSRLQLRSPGLALFAGREELWSDNDRIGPQATGAFRFLDTHYVYDDDTLLKRRLNGAEISAFDLNGHVAFRVNGLPVELCGSAAPLKLIAGANEIQGQKNRGMYEFEAMGCVGVKLGEHVSVRNASRVRLDEGNGIKGRSSYTAGFANTTQVAVNLNQVKVKLGYEVSVEESQNIDATRTADIVGQRLSVGVAY